MRAAFTAVIRAVAVEVIAVAILGAVVFLAACSSSAQPDASGPVTSRSASPSAHPSGDSTASGIRLLGPDEPVKLDGDPIAVVVEVLENGRAVPGKPLTFTVVSGPARFPGGFETVLTDDTGVAAAITLEGTGTGDVTLRVTNGERTTTVTVTLVA